MREPLTYSEARPSSIPTVRHGGNVNPSRNRKSGTETPHLQRGAPDFYPSDPDFWCAFEDGEGMVIGDEPGNTR